MPNSKAKPIEAPSVIDDPAGDLRSLVDAEEGDQEIMRSHQAPAMHTDVLPGGPRPIHNITDDPIWVETKTEYDALLKKHGLVNDVRDNHNKDDKSPWATRTRLRPGQRDPFLHPASHDPPPPDQDIHVPASTNTPERTTATLGEERMGVEAIQLSLDQMRLVREYGRFVTDAKLDSWTYCKHCVDLNNLEETRCGVTIKLDIVFIHCQCCLRFGNGATALSPRLLIPQPPSHMAFALGIPEVPYPDSIIGLYQRYEKLFLKPLSLFEALRCVVCYDAGRQDGIDPGNGKSFRLKCRCQKRVRQGITMT